MKSLLYRLRQELDLADFTRLGAIAYVIHLNRQFFCNKEIYQCDIHRFYEAKKILIYGDLNNKEKPKARKRYERRLKFAEKAFRESDPSWDIPF